MSDLRHTRVVPFPITESATAAELMERMAGTSFQARQLADAGRIARLRIPVNLVATNTADLRISEGSDQGAQALGLEHRVGVGESDDLTDGIRHTGVESARLADPIEGDHAHPDRRETTRDVDAGVGRAVRDDKNVEKIAWIIDRQQVVQLVGEHRLFVVNRHDEGQARRDGSLSYRPRTKAS